MISILLLYGTWVSYRNILIHLMDIEEKELISLAFVSLTVFRPREAGGFLPRKAGGFLAKLLLEQIKFSTF